MKKFSFLRKKGKSNFHIIVALSDWCPACLEYKVILNKIVSEMHIEISFYPPETLPIHSVPTTIFVKGKKMHIERGLMNYEAFLQKCALFLRIFK